MNLRTIIERNDTKSGRIFDLIIQFLIAISIITFSLETLPGLDPTTIVTLRIVEVIIVVIFSIEYILRIFVSTSKLDYIFSFYGIVDLAVILPFYLSSGIDLRSLRILRMIRLFRTVKLFRYNKAIQRFARAFAIAKEELVLFGVVTTMLIYLAAVGIYYFENEAQPEVFQSVFHSLWWAVITLTTVGYGDTVPITLGGRLFTFVILMGGLGIIAIPSGLLASALSKVRLDEERESTKSGEITTHQKSS